MSSHVKLKTISMKVTNKNYHNIFDYMTKVSKNIYNSTIFCSTIFNKYKCDIFKQIYVNFKNKYNKYILTEENDISTIIKNEIEKNIYELYDYKYDQYIKLNSLITANNKIIYAFIRNLLKPINGIQLLKNESYDIIHEIILHNILKNKNIQYTNENKKETVIDIIDNILNNIYLKLFKEHKIDGKCIIKKQNINWKKQIELTFKIKLVSDNNIIGRVTYKHLGENVNKLPSDVIINIIQKAYTGYKSYFALRKQNIRSSTPKYLPKNEHYSLPYFKRSFRIINNKYLQLTVGNYVSKNYIDIIKNKNMICINKNEKTICKKYTHINNLKIGNKVNKAHNFILENDMHINKNNKSIINPNFINIHIPNKLKTKDIKYIEIVPVYENYCYKINIIYEEIVNSSLDKTLTEDAETNQLNENLKNPDNSISIDLGLTNLMSIYDRIGNPYIISGKYLLWLNNSYNYLIDKAKSNIKKVNNQNSSNYIRNLLIERNNKIDYYFNMLVKWLMSKYKTKKLIIIGYNTGWKNKVNIGAINNRKFYGIPYTKLMYKLTNLIREAGIEVKINEESYTSKCDGLSLEEVCFHKSYLGKRISRGLFSSNTNVLLNADINGCNPIKVKNIGKEVHQMNHILKANSTAGLIQQ